MHNIIWDELKTAGGNGAHLPRAIAAMSSPDAETRRAANSAIDNFVVRQGDLYEAAYYVIEPIIRLLERDYTFDRFYPLTILAEIALGCGYNAEITLQDTGEITTIDLACHNKLKELRPRIEKIVAITPEEITERESTLEAIDDWEERMLRWAERNME